jgi:hypothetical protein
MFYALFGLCAVLPLLREVARARGIEEPDPWRTAVRMLRPGAPGAAAAPGVSAASERPATAGGAPPASALSQADEAAQPSGGA